MGVIAICVAESLSELTQLFPAPNAIVEYVRAFIDEDFGWVIGIAYWFTYSSIFAAQNLMAANLAVYWGLKPVWQIIIFYFVTPGMIVGINLVGVGTFGWVEAVGGILKIVLVVGITIVLYVMAGQEHHWSEGRKIQAGFVYNEKFTTNKYRALAYVIPMVAFGFLGIETVAVTAFEARTSRSLRLPSQSIAYVTLLLYFLCLLGQCLNVPWTDSHLPLIYGGIGDGATDTKDLRNPASSSLTILALWAWGKKHLAGFLNGAMIFSVLSASNTSLYVASRTLYGVARDVPTSNLLGRLIHGLSVVVPKTGVPARALVFSALSFIWLPFVTLKGGYAVQYLIEIIQISSSVSCLIVWASVSFAYLRYYIWLKHCKKHLVGDYEQFRRSTGTYKPFTLLAFAQPLPAIISIVGCLIVFAFCSATWWDKEVTFSKVAIGYAAPLILLVLFIIFKIINRRLWIRTSDDFSSLSQTLDRLKWYKLDEVDMSPQRHHEEATRVLSPPQVASPPEGSTLELVEIGPN
ncbi:uncharacterized protein K460DRAFT_362993 [Cucurbitaria berberidis CBS 394.84]|uniref:Amino acid permease/ SLC12A domain-containing protein n=1 Tax=Cucurbitaria berberidis CBS 394.84 TaxID=1168544 RepID=A0A9P4L9Z9_9PLEO|nr:uncharacterized protein K460DRAFT_362993 [Cucurbitaria berberidis CBS 394.84]KAF1846862.1 hypothetical protein K460DRAFT_362993 [Cucurbitaria berberidis CBS 394.84]